MTRRLVICLYSARGNHFWTGSLWSLDRYEAETYASALAAPRSLPYHGRHVRRRLNRYYLEERLVVAEVIEWG